MVFRRLRGVAGNDALIPHIPFQRAHRSQRGAVYPAIPPKPRKLVRVLTNCRSLFGNPKFWAENAVTRGSAQASQGSGAGARRLFVPRLYECSRAIACAGSDSPTATYDLREFIRSAIVLREQQLRDRADDNRFRPPSCGHVHNVRGRRVGRYGPAWNDRRRRRHVAR